MTLYGFAILRNGVMYDYPFKESLLSLAPIVKSTVMALGDSKDDTEQEVRSLGIPIEFVHTMWDENFRKSGLILSQQTNIALDHLKKKYSSPDAWGFYLQSDEVLHEDDHGIILSDIEKAQKEGYDAISFHYLHFWQAYDQVAMNWWWYPQEIRAIKLDSKIQSYGDAQSFENCKKVYQSNARIFHYGHVREENAYSKKRNDFQLWWHSTADKLEKAKQKSQKRMADTTTARYLGSHPLVMEQRAGGFSYPTLENINIVGDKSKFDQKFLDKIRAKNVSWFTSKKQITNSDPTVILEGSAWERFWDFSKVPKKHKSEVAKPWPYEFWATFKISEKGICIGSGPKPSHGPA